MKSFGGITSKLVRGISPMVCLSAMLGISPMVCIWGVPHTPVSVLLRSGEQNPLTLPLFGRMPEPLSGRRKLFGSPQAPYLRWGVFGNCPSPRVYMGSAPCPQDRTLPLFGEPNPNQEDASCLGVPKPHISDGMYLGVAQAPRCIWGVPHAPKTGRCCYSGECPNPNQKDASCLGVPKPHISDGVFLGVAQAPRCLWGVPHAPKTRRCRYSGSRTQFFIFHFSFLTSNSILHDTKHQLERHDVLQTTY